MLSDVLHAGMKVHVVSTAGNRISSVITQIKHQKEHFIVYIYIYIYLI